MGAFVYGLCALTSMTCFALLFRQYRRTRSRIALWSSVAFLFFTGANAILFVDLIVVPQIDLRIWGNLANLAGGLTLLMALTDRSDSSDEH